LLPTISVAHSEQDLQQFADALDAFACDVSAG
jgi:hypothetical protein